MEISLLDLFHSYKYIKYRSNEPRIDLSDDIMFATFIYMHEMPRERDSFPICKVITQKNFITTTRLESISNDISVNNCCLTS